MAKKRYFIRMSYRGDEFHGFQRQDDVVTVQSCVEDHLSVFLREQVSIIGCGRTDAGVHARCYYFHLDLHSQLPDQFIHKVNAFLPEAIAIEAYWPVDPEKHARFDAIERAYEYHIDGFKNPFGGGLNWYFSRFDQLDFEKLREAASLLLEYEEFYPFCKSNTDVQTMRCQLLRSNWILNSGDKPHLVYHIRANRFLRGMVRLIVGMCLNVSLGKISMNDVREALDHQARLEKSWSVPPNGLFLTDVVYPFPLD